jgi:hypothetical protein
MLIRFRRPSLHPCLPIPLFLWVVCLTAVLTFPRITVGATIQCGDTITANLLTAASVDQYTYTASAGETLTLSFVGDGNCFNDGKILVVEVYDPSGRKLTQLSHCGIRVTNLTTSVSGNYTFLVHDDDYSQTGGYFLSLQSFTGGGCVSTPVRCGETITNTLSKPTELDAFSYTGTAGETLSLSLVGSGNCFNDGQLAVLDFYSPVGQKLATLNHCGNRVTNVTLLASGAYTILVHDDDYAQPGGYSFSLQSFTGGGCVSTPLSCGQTITNTLAKPTELDAFSYTGTAGETLSLSLVGTGNCFNDGQTAVLDLYSPVGQKLATLNHCGNRVTNLTLSASGTYTILVHDNDYAQSGGYSFSLQSFTGGGCVSTPVSCGQTITNTLSKPTELDAFSYAGSAGEALSLSLAGTGNCFNDGQIAVLDLYSPVGQKLATLSHCGNRVTNVTLLASGTYTILVHDDDYAQPGGYSFSLQSFTGGGCDTKPLVCGQGVGGQISRPSEVDAYNIAGCAGDVAILVANASGNCFNDGQIATFDVYRPNGQRLTRLNHCGVQSTNLTLPEDGLYTLLVHDDDYAQSSTYTLTWTCLIQACQAPVIIVPPQSQTVVAGTPACLSVFVKGADPLVYQWRLNGAPIAGATATNYCLPNVRTNDAGDYDVVVTNLQGSVTSAPLAHLTVLVPPEIVLQPQDQTVFRGSDASFTSTAVGTDPVAYQWQFNSNAISGAGAARLDLQNVQAPNDGFYLVQASNIAGIALSRSARLTVLPFTRGDIGDTGHAGNATYSNSVFSLTGSGEDIEGTADAFQFVHQSFTGDCEVIARVLALKGGDAAFAEAGLMMRENLTTGSRHVFVGLNSGSLVFRRRLSADDYSVQNTKAFTNAPIAWLRLMRLGDTFIGFSSTNGSDWSYAWFTTVALSPTLEVGLAVTAHSYGLLANASFDHVNAGGLTALGGKQPFPAQIYLGGEALPAVGFGPQGGFKILLDGQPGDWLRVQGTTDFLSWLPVSTVTNRYGVVDFIDSQALTNGRRFYRVQRLGP